MTSFYRTIQAALLLILTTGVFALEKGSKVRVELKNGSVIIGEVVRTHQYTAWIRTRYGIFTVGYGSIRNTRVITPPPKTNSRPPATNTRPPVRPTVPKGWSTGVVLSVNPAAGESGGELNTGFDAGAVLMLRLGVFAPGIRISYERHTASSIPDATLSMLNIDAALRFYFLNTGKTGFYAEVSPGFSLAKASLSGLSSQGLRFRFGARFGVDIMLSKGFIISPGGGFLMTLEEGANLLTFPFLLEARIRL